MRWSIRCANKNTLEIACVVHLNLLLLNRQLLPPGMPGDGETGVNIVLAISKIVVYCLQYNFLQRNTYKYLCQCGPWQWSMWRENLFSFRDPVKWLQSDDGLSVALSKPHADAEIPFCIPLGVGCCGGLMSTSGLINNVIPETGCHCSLCF